MPLRIVVRAREKDEVLKEKARVEIRQLERVTVHPSLFDIPDGYVRTEGLRTHLEL
jgi:hypothetical protein